MRNADCIQEFHKFKILFGPTAAAGVEMSIFRVGEVSLAFLVFVSGLVLDERLVRLGGELSSMGREVSMPRPLFRAAMGCTGDVSKDELFRLEDDILFKNWSRVGRVRRFFIYFLN